MWMKYGNVRSGYSVHNCHIPNGIATLAPWDQCQAIRKLVITILIIIVIIIKITYILRKVRTASNADNLDTQRISAYTEFSRSTHAWRAMISGENNFTASYPNCTL
jgi:hypothetical protein